MGLCEAMGPALRRDKVIDKELMEILACPACKAEVYLDEQKEKIVCKGCGKRYPIRDGIPVMLIEEAEEKESA
jgi:uncharacterized protein